MFFKKGGEMQKVKRLLCVLLAGFVLAALPVSQAVAKNPQKETVGEKIKIPGLDKKSKEKNPAEIEVPTTTGVAETTPAGLLPDKVLTGIEKGAKSIRGTINKDGSIRDTVNVTASYVLALQDNDGVVAGYGLTYVLMITLPAELFMPEETLTAKEKADRNKFLKKVNGAVVKLLKLNAEKLLFQHPELINVTLQINDPSGGVLRIVSDASALRELPKNTSAKSVLNTIVVSERVVLVTQSEYSFFKNMQEFLDLFFATYPNEFRALIEKFQQIKASETTQQQQSG